MGSSARSNIRTLFKRDGKNCHYCNKELSYSKATRDHIFPRSLGGPNSLENYVVACSDCNHTRGNTLFFCGCRDCEEIILDSLYNKEILFASAGAIFNANKPKIRKRGSGRTAWQVSQGPISKRFSTHQCAVDFLAENNYSLTQEVKYE